MLEIPSHNMEWKQWLDLSENFWLPEFSLLFTCCWCSSWCFSYSVVYRIFVSQGKRGKTDFRFNFRVHNSLVAILHRKNVVGRIEMIVGWVVGWQWMDDGDGNGDGDLHCAALRLCVRSRPAYWQHWQPLAHRRNFATCSPKFSLPVFAFK